MAVQSYRVALSVDSTYKKASSSLARVEQRNKGPLREAGPSVRDDPASFQHMNYRARRSSVRA